MNDPLDFSDDVSDTTSRAESAVRTILGRVDKRPSESDEGMLDFTADAGEGQGSHDFDDQQSDPNAGLIAKLQAKLDATQDVEDVGKFPGSPEEFGALAESADKIEQSAVSKVTALLRKRGVGPDGEDIIIAPEDDHVAAAESIEHNEGSDEYVRSLFDTEGRSEEEITQAVADYRAGGELPDAPDADDDLGDYWNAPNDADDDTELDAWASEDRWGRSVCP